MSANTQFAVAIHILTLLARYPNQPLTSHHIATSIGTNPALVRKMMGQLARAGLIKTGRGKEGGTVLAMTPEEISLEAVHAALGSQKLYGVHRTSDPSCPVGQKMPSLLPALFEDFEDAVTQQMRGKNLRTLLDKI
jgi:Rrf2 family protein